MNNRSEYPLACEYLGQIRAADRHVEWLRDRKMNLQMLLTDTSVHLPDMPHSDSLDLQKHQTIQAEIDEMEREFKEAETAAAATRLEVGRTVCRLSDTKSQKVLLLRYLENMSWWDIASEIKYSPAQTYRFRDAGYVSWRKCWRRHDSGHRKRAPL